MSAVVAVVRCADYDRGRVEDAISRALELLGGAGRFFPPGGRILVKPNLLGPRPRASCVATDPEVVRAVLTRAREFTDHLSYGDSPGVGSAKRVTRASGYTPIMHGAGASLTEFSNSTKIAGIRLKQIELAGECLQADTLVNVAKAKTHAQMGMTLATKNLFGCVVGTRKAAWHLRAGHDRRQFARMLVEVAAAARARLHVLDAVVAMEGNGPGAGTPRPVGALLASDDPVALDRVACELLNVPPRAVPVFAAASDLGFGVTDLARIEIVGDDLSVLRVRDFKAAAHVGLPRILPLPRAVMLLVRRLLTSRPEFNAKLCRECGLCVRVCPPKCLRLSGGRPVVRRAECIECFCCQEVCPCGAITARAGPLARLLR